MAGPEARRNTAVAASILYFVTIPFLVLVIIGNTNKSSSVLMDMYLFKLDVSQIIPIAVANAGLLNSVARSLGLHDFYQVGLWNFCEGYDAEGVTFCSRPVQFYWFNPVEILVSELLAGAKIALPAQVITVLGLLRIGSRLMYGCFMTGIVVNFLLIFASPLVIRTRWFTLLVGTFALVSAVVLNLAAIIATVISLAAKMAITAQDQLNLRAKLGLSMLVSMWIGAILTSIAFLLHAAMGCCCKPHRPLATAESSRTSPEVKKSDLSLSLPSFVRRRRNAAP
ncbi:SUR7 protein [Drechmeria coniospora]|uniref:SUR7 protein n=1 Tax=Drechmeria coniospora TaxID=98403 RepID=A0A151GT84_DRECN|nr:SUR7 protein [Drechmeria coniospora]KYK60288.1 SUR7 protein [Drechmeria coniospora]